MDKEIWNALIAVAEGIHAAAPWKGLEEDEFFAIQPRTDGPVYFASVMGMAGVHRAVAFYKGIEGLHGFRRANDDSISQRLAMESLLLCEQFQLSFENKKSVLPPDMDVLKACGKRYRGAWPVFHAHRPGRIPWTIREDEAAELVVLLERSLEIFQRLGRGEALVRPFMADEFFLVDPEGRDSVVRVDDLPMTRHILQFALPQGALDGLQRVDRELEVEIALMVAPIQTGVDGEAPFLPFLVLAVDRDSGMVVAHDMVDARDGVDAAMIQMPEKLAGMLRGAGMVPATIRARHPFLLPLLNAFCQTYEIELVEVEEFDHADFLVREMQRSLR